MYDRVVTINNTHWPAYRKPGATLVDLRMFDPNDRSANPLLVFRSEKLRELGIPDALIEAAENLIRRDSCCSTTCRIRRSQQPAMPRNPQANNPSSRVRETKASLTQILPRQNHP